jgi:hypothetical protein
MPTPVVAANAYAQLARIAEQGTSLSKTIGDAASGPSFEALINERGADRRKSTAGAGSARHRGGRSGNTPGTLPSGGRGGRLCYAA